MTIRIRITFAKQGALRYIGHLDLHKLWESATRRAGIALAYSQGFHPQPKIQLASALPLGFSSRCEIADMWVEDDPSTAAALMDGNFQSRLQNSLPSGIIVRQLTQVDERVPPLQTQVIASEFEVTLLDDVDVDALTRSLSALIEADSIPRERRGKTYDLKPLIEELVFSATPAPSLRMRLTAREGATGRPEEVLAALGIPMEATRIERTKLVFA